MRFLSFFIILILSGACQTTEKPQKKRLKSKRSLSQVSPASERRGKPFKKKKKAKKPSQDNLVEVQCRYLEFSLKPGLKSLVDFRGKPLTSKSPYKAVSELSHEKCMRLNRKKLAILLKNVKGLSEKKMALVLPLSGENAHQGTLLLSGIKSYFKFSDQKNFSDMVTLYDSRSSPVRAKRIYTELFLRNQSSLILGGVLEEELPFLSEFSLKLRSPVLAFNDFKQQTKRKNPYFFQVTPGNHYLSSALAKTCQKRGLKSIAILEPEDGHASSLIDNLIEELGKRSIKVKKIASYRSGDFESMSQAVTKLFDELDPPEKEGKSIGLAALGRPESEEQEKEIPSPTISFDGLFVPDNFRILKHFIKLFHFHKLSKVTLIGNGQWRSDELTDFWENFLEGGFFVDYLGDYQNIPSTLVTRRHGSNLSRADEIVKIDLQMIGYYGAKIALLSQERKLKYRHQLAQSLHDLSREKIFEERGETYKPQKGFHWPSYIFNLKGRGIHLQSQL